MTGGPEKKEEGRQKQQPQGYLPQHEAAWIMYSAEKRELEGGVYGSAPPGTKRKINPFKKD